MSPGLWVAFLVAAGVGAPARYLLDGYVQERTAGEFPWGTWVVNVSGSFVLGLLTGLALFHAFPSDAKLVLGTGFCGAYTTFSTFTFETLHLAEDANNAGAAANVALSTVAALAAAAAGIALAAL